MSKECVLFQTFKKCVIFQTLESLFYLKTFQPVSYFRHLRVCPISDSHTPKRLHTSSMFTLSRWLPLRITRRKTKHLFLPRAVFASSVCTRSSGSLSPSFTQRETLNNLTMGGNAGARELPPCERGVVVERVFLFIGFYVIFVLFVWLFPFSSLTNSYS